jgi:hypothetical protein
VKPLAIWIAIVAVVFGGYALLTRNANETKQVFVFVDSSNQMKPVWSDVRRELDRIDDADYSEFALATGQSLGLELVHTWQPEFEFVGVEPFAPCSFEGIDQFPEAAEADKRILITTTDSTECPTTALVDWQIIQLAP